MLGMPQDNHFHTEGDMKAHNAVTPIAIPFITRHRKRFRTLGNVSYEDNPYFHSEPYGYLIADDVIYINIAF
jgi:hypothetical protein